MASNATTFDEYDASRQLREARMQEEQGADAQNIRQAQAKQPKQSLIGKATDFAQKIVNRQAINRLWLMTFSVTGFLIGLAGLNALWFMQATGISLTRAKLAWYDKIGIILLDALVFFIVFTLLTFLYWIVDNILEFMVKGVVSWDWLAG